MLVLLKWLFTWVYFVSLICFTGAVLGVLSHLAYGVLFAQSPDYCYLAAFGFSNGLQYGGVWAGGFAIVLCVMRAHKQHVVKQEANR